MEMGEDGRKMGRRPQFRIIIIIIIIIIQLAGIRRPHTTRSSTSSYDMAERYVPDCEIEEIPSFQRLSPSTRWVCRSSSTPASSSPQLSAVTPVQKKTSPKNNNEGSSLFRALMKRLTRGESQRLPSPRVIVPMVVEGEQAAAGSPSWLAAVAGEAISGWVPLTAASFEIKKLGQGILGNVCKAWDTLSGTLVALKKVRFDNMDPESVCFMAREILILRHRLDHPNIVKLEGLVTSRMSYSIYLVVEYMEHDLDGLAAIPGQKFTEP